MSNRLQGLLESRPWLLADGATGTNYFAMGLETGDPPELWNIDHPDRVRGLHERFIEAGADIVLTNSFGGSSYRLKLHNADGRVAEINRAAAALAREAADAADREVVVAGSIGPTGEIFAPVGSLSLEDGTAAFAEQAQALAEGGADALWIETISSVEELTAALAGAGTTALPVICTLSFDTNGRTMMGVTAAQVAGLAHDLEPRPLAYGGNCGTGPAELMAVLLKLTDASRPDDVIVAKSNCGIPEFLDGEIRYSGTPELMADCARLARDAGVRIIGGCCGTTPEHIAAMRQALESHEPAGRPTLETVTARLGQVSRGASEEDGPAGAERRNDAAAGRRRGRRRRGSADDCSPQI